MMRDVPDHPLDPAELESLIAESLRRWLRVPRRPEHARIGARKIAEFLRLSGVRARRGARQAPPRTF